MNSGVILTGEVDKYTLKCYVFFKEIPSLQTTLAIVSKWLVLHKKERTVAHYSNISTSKMILV